MHEMSLCQSIREVIEDRARADGFAEVKLVRLEIGRFSCVEKQALEFAFDAAMRGSVAAGARLEICDLPGRAMCYDCMKEVEIDDRFSPCPICGGTMLMPVAGDEMRIKNLEVI